MDEAARQVPSPDEVVSFLGQLARRLRMLGHRKLEPYGLSVIKINTLRVLLDYKGAEPPLTQREVEESLATQSAWFSKTVGELHRDKLVERGSGEDRRSRILRITEKGEEALSRADRVYMPALHRVFATISDAVRVHTLAMLGLIWRNVDLLAGKQPDRRSIEERIDEAIRLRNRTMSPPERLLVALLLTEKKLNVARHTSVPEQLTHTEFRMLRLLPARSPVPQREIESALGAAAPSISQTIARLEARGYVRQEPMKNDKRRRILMLTKAGGGALHVTHPEAWEAGRILASMEEADRAAFLQVLGELDQNAREAMDER